MRRIFRFLLKERGEPNDRQRSFANMLMDFIESADEILSAEDDFKAALTEW